MRTKTNLLNHLVRHLPPFGSDLAGGWFGCFYLHDHAFDGRLCVLAGEGHNIVALHERGVPFCQGGRRHVGEVAGGRLGGGLAQRVIQPCGVCPT